MGNEWVCSHAAAQYQGIPQMLPDVADKTVKAKIISGMGGAAFRIILAEHYSAEKVVYDAVKAEVRGKVFTLTKEGNAQISVLPESEVVLDPVQIAVEAGEEITLWLHAESEKASQSATIVNSCHSIKGDYTGEEFECEPYTSPMGPFGKENLCGYSRMEVLTEKGAQHIVAVLGDSITARELWTAPIQKRWLEEKKNMTLLNFGISGNRLLRDTNFPYLGKAQLFGENALFRLERDILPLSEVDTIIAAMGVNDISQPGGREGMSPPLLELCTVEELMHGFEKVIELCHKNAKKVIGCTITPFGGYTTYSDALEQMRQEVNQWIRDNRQFDAVIDFAKALEDKEDESCLWESYDCGDHLHPSEEGGSVMADRAYKVMNTLFG